MVHVLSAVDLGFRIVVLKPGGPWSFCSVLDSEALKPTLDYVKILY